MQVSPLRCIDAVVGLAEREEEGSRRLVERLCDDRPPAVCSWTIRLGLLSSRFAETRGTVQHVAFACRVAVARKGMLGGEGACERKECCGTVVGRGVGSV